MTFLRDLAGWVPYLTPVALATLSGLAWVFHRRNGGDR